MRISDWSSDVCSSDLIDGHRRAKIFSPAYNYAFLPRAVFCGATYSNARVVKLVDAGDSKSPAARRAGSIPAPGTSLKYSALPHYRGINIHQTRLITPFEAAQPSVLAPLEIGRAHV